MQGLWTTRPKPFLFAFSLSRLTVSRRRTCFLQIYVKIVYFVGTSSPIAFSSNCMSSQTTFFAAGLRSK